MKPTRVKGWICDAGIAPERVAVHRVPFAAELSCEAEIAVAAAVVGCLGAEEVGVEVDDWVGGGCLSLGGYK